MNTTDAFIDGFIKAAMMTNPMEQQRQKQMMSGQLGQTLHNMSQQDQLALARLVASRTGMQGSQFNINPNARIV